MKKVFLAFLSLLVITLVGWGVYAILGNTKKDQVADIPDAAEPGQNLLPTQSGETFTALSEGVAIGSSLDATGDALFYISPDTRYVQKIDLATGTTEPIGVLNFTPTKAFWSPDHTQVLAEARQDNARQWYLLSLATRTELPLKKGLESPAWINNGTNIFYKFYSPDPPERSLNVSNPDGSSWKKLAATDVPFLDVAPLGTSGDLLLWNRGSALEETLLRAINTATGEVSTVFSGKYGAEYLPSPDGSRVLISHIDQKNGRELTLATINRTGGEYRSLGIPTLIPKVTWSKSGSSLYYAEPAPLPSGATLPNDYYGSLRTKDSFWRIDLETGNKQPVVPLEKITQSIDATDLVVDEEEQFLYFTNRYDGRLYKLFIEQ